MTPTICHFASISSPVISITNRRGRNGLDRTFTSDSPIEFRRVSDLSSARSRFARRHLYLSARFIDETIRGLCPTTIAQVGQSVNERVTQPCPSSSDLSPYLSSAMNESGAVVGICVTRSKMAARRRIVRSRDYRESSYCEPRSRGSRSTNLS